MSDLQFISRALQLFEKQSRENLLYREYIHQLKQKSTELTALDQLPFLPISFFKTHTIQTGVFEPELFFESSGTTGAVNSRHVVRDLKSYLSNTEKNFKEFYGDPTEYCFLGLLPSYLERGNSSLVAMVDYFITMSNHTSSGFFLHDFKKLYEVLIELEAKKQKTILIGVTFALLDFLEQFSLQLKHTIVMETGGMKGRKTELTRAELHEILKKGFGVASIHAEYGMTELMSQAYSKGDGIFYPASTMRILLRSMDDPFEMWSADEHIMRTGVINVIDLANKDSIGFIATEDLARFTGNGGIELLGRIDNTDMRGCSLLTA